MKTEVPINTLRCYVLERDLFRQIENSEVVDDIMESVKRMNMVFFFGAGASAEYPSCLPLGNDLRYFLRLMLLERGKIEFPNREQSELMGLGLEILLDYFCKTLGEGALEFYDILKPKSYSFCGPNFRHYFLAFLSKHRFCRNFITVNFDTAIEEAFERLRIPLVVPENFGENEKNFYNTFSLKSDRRLNYLFKIHGTLNDTVDPQNRHLLATVERVGIGLPVYKKRILEAVMSSYDTFYTGYNSEFTDIDVFPVITRTNSKKSIFWHVYSNDSNTLNNISNQVKRFLLHRRGYILLTKDITGFFAYLLSSLNVDFTSALENMGVKQLREIEDKENEIKAIRKAEQDSFIQTYVRKYFSSPAPAYLILANIMQKPGLWNTAEQLLRECEKTLPESNLALKYAFSSNQAEVYRNSAKLSSAINTRKGILQFLVKTNFEPRGKRKYYIYQLIRNGSDYMGLCKVSVKEFIKIKNLLILGPVLKNLSYAILHFVTAYREAKHATKEFDEFDRGTFNSMLNFEIADFFQFIQEGMLYWGLTIRTKYRTPFFLIRKFTYFPSVIAEVFYRRSIEREPTQSSDWYFFQKHRLAEVIMHRERKPTIEVSNLIEDTKAFYDWGKSVKVAGEGDANLGVCRGIKSFYEGKLEKAVEILEDTYKAYKDESHYSGMFKAKLYLALCEEKKGQIKALQECLSDIAHVLKKYE